MEREVARHMGVLMRDFENGVLDENCVENGDESHFVINLESGQTLGSIDDNKIRYADVISGGVGTTMCVFQTAQEPNCSHFSWSSSSLALIRYAGSRTTYPASHTASERRDVRIERSWWKEEMYG
jgi:hypothetical protein